MTPFVWPVSCLLWKRVLLCWNRSSRRNALRVVSLEQPLWFKMSEYCWTEDMEFPTTHQIRPNTPRTIFQIASVSKQFRRSGGTTSMSEECSPSRIMFPDGCQNVIGLGSQSHFITYSPIRAALGIGGIILR